MQPVYADREVAERDWYKQHGMMATMMKRPPALMGTSVRPSELEIMSPSPPYGVEWSDKLLTFPSDWNNYSLSVVIMGAISATTASSSSEEGITRYWKMASLLTSGTSAAIGRLVVAGGRADAATGFAEKVRLIRSTLGLDRSALADKLGISRPTEYRIEAGGEPKDPEVRKKITNLYQISCQIRAGYVVGPSDSATLTAWLDSCLSGMDRKQEAKAIQNGRITYGAHPTDSAKLIRVNSDGSRQSGVWTDAGFVADEG